MSDQTYPLPGQIFGWAQLDRTDPLLKEREET